MRRTDMKRTDMKRTDMRRTAIGGTDIRRKTTAYLTVEAALVLPIVLGFVVSIMYLLFFQYNRCMLEQDMGALALRGNSLWVGDKTTLLGELHNQADKIDYEKYIAWQQGMTNIRLEGNHTYVEGDGNVLFPFYGLGAGDVNPAWHIKVSFQNQRVEPVAFVRNWRKWIGGK